MAGEVGWRFKKLTCRYVTFVVIGFLDILTALSLAVVYFNVRSLTTSLEKVETVPTYANAIMLMCTGILTIVLYMKRESILFWPAGGMNVACLLFYTTCAILGGIQNANTLHKAKLCLYSAENSRCQCYFSDGSGKYPTLGDLGITKVVYNGAPSCQAIQTDLKACMYAMCGLYGAGALLCLLGFIMVLVNSKFKKKTTTTTTYNRFDRGREYIQMIHPGNAENHDSVYSFDYGMPPSGLLRTDSPESRNTVLSQPQNHNAETRQNESGSRRMKFSRQITLPGMGFCLLNQQLSLPGDDRLQLLSVQRTDSANSANDSIQHGTVHPSAMHTTNVINNRDNIQQSSQSNVQRTANLTPGVHGHNRPRSIQNNMRSGSIPSRYRQESRQGTVRSINRTTSLSPGVHTQNDPVRRRVSLESSRTNATGQGLSQRHRDLGRSQSDLGPVERQRAVSIFRLGHAIQQNRNEATRRPHSNLQNNQPRHGHSVERSCSHCREYRQWRSMCRQYRGHYPNNNMLPVQQQVMLMNYLLSAQQGRQVNANVPSFVYPEMFEPPPPYQE